MRAASSSGFDKFMANLGGEGIKEERTFPIVRNGAETNFRGAPRHRRDVVPVTAVALTHWLISTQVLKADTAGSVEAITSSLEGLDVQDDVSRVKAKVIYSGVGDLTKSDIAVASVQGAFVVAFNAVRKSKFSLCGRGTEIARREELSDNLTHCVIPTQVQRGQ